MTSGAFIVQDIQKVDGYVNNLPIGGNVICTFTNKVASVMVHNTTGDYISVTINTIPVALGNQTAFIAPGSAMSFGDYHLASIDNIDISDMGITTDGGGIVLINGFYY